MLQSDPEEMLVEASEEESNLSPRRLLYFLSPKCRSAPNDNEEKHVQAYEEDSDFSQTREAAEITSSPSSFCV